MGDFMPRAICLFCVVLLVLINDVRNFEQIAEIFPVCYLLTTTGFYKLTLVCTRRLN